ncbi:MAG TPA: metallophosphoesterase [Coleofasciculaceae cyanobacterium]|jgi:3',5'-cyclic AMP phosphodiesterase CpdA
MDLNFRFAVVSDLHIGLPHTIWDNPSRFHLVEVSIPALEHVLDHLTQQEIDFLLLPGDLTQHGERDNHAWLQERLSQLPFPVYVVPGNHDVPNLLPNEPSIGLKDFPYYYRQFGYDDSEQLYYTCEVLPGVQLIGLNSNQFDASGKQVGCLDEQQLAWLEQVLTQVQDKLVLVMIHHNVVEHLPGQADHPLGRRYMLDNASVLRKILKAAGVNLVFTGHLHVQDVAYHEGIYDITTGSLVSYPHPYRIVQLRTNDQGKRGLQIQSYRVSAVPGWENLPEMSRQWIGDRSYPFMLKLLTAEPLNLSLADAQQLVPSLRYFWADIAAGDPLFNFPDFFPAARRYFEAYSAITHDGKPAFIDNHTTLLL